MLLNLRHIVSKCSLAKDTRAQPLAFGALQGRRYSDSAVDIISANAAVKTIDLLVTLHTFCRDTSVIMMKVARHGCTIGYSARRSSVGQIVMGAQGCG